MNLSSIAQHRAEDHVADWTTFVQAFRNADCGFATAYGSLFAPLHAGAVDDLMVVAQLGQSLDGRIATPTGHSKYINGTDGLDHLHRLRALVDAVVVGVGTALADDPQLTVRRVSGPNPARVVLDPQGRLPPQAKLLADDGTRRIVIGCEAGRSDLPAGVEYVPLAKHDGQLAPSMVLTELAARGFRRILIEGGADTISRFAHAGCLDRLHVVVAPIILGAGRPGINLPAIDRVDQAMRAPMRAVALGDEVLFDCDLSAQRRPVGCAKKST
jgi:riboflavin-specific deaminase-like protein